MKTDNELIAEFMGMKHQIQVGPFGGEYLYVKNPVTKEFEIPKFEISWDWLMPVVEKINKTSYGAVHLNRSEIFLHRYTRKKREELLDFRHDGSMIEATYKAVVEFIKWYNQQSNG